MPKASDITADQNISILLKASPGSGKTIAACSFAVYGPVWLAYFDKRVPIEVLTYYKSRFPHLLDNIEYESYSSHNANEYLNKLMKFQKDCRYVAIITDSVTMLTASAVNWSMGFRKPGGNKDSVNPNSMQLIPDFDEYKVETSLVTQALDLSKALPVFNIWTAHPLPKLNLQASDSGKINRVSTANTIVSYGNKVGSMIPGSFQEIYHLGRELDRRIVWTDMVGDDYAKTCYPGMPQKLDITNKLFAEVWREEVAKSMGGMNEIKVEAVVNPNADRWK